MHFDKKGMKAKMQDLKKDVDAGEICFNPLLSPSFHKHFEGVPAFAFAIHFHGSFGAPVF